MGGVHFHLGFAVPLLPITAVDPRSNGRGNLSSIMEDSFLFWSGRACLKVVWLGIVGVEEFRWFPLLSPPLCASLLLPPLSAQLLEPLPSHPLPSTFSLSLSSLSFPVIPIFIYISSCRTSSPKSRPPLPSLSSPWACMSPPHDHKLESPLLISSPPGSLTTSSLLAPKARPSRRLTLPTRRSSPASTRPTRRMSTLPSPPPARPLRTTGVR